MTETEKSVPVILLIGQSGCGKSTFVKESIPTSGVIPSDSLNSPKTLQDCKEYQSDDCSYYLVETPGFNDTWAKDEAVAEKIIRWLRAQEKRSYRRGVTAILYITGNGQRDHKPLENICSILSKHAHLHPVTNVEKKPSNNEKGEKEHWTFEGKDRLAVQIIGDLLREKQVEGRGREQDSGLMADVLREHFRSRSSSCGVGESKGSWFSNLWRRFLGFFPSRSQAGAL